MKTKIFFRLAALSLAVMSYVSLSAQTQVAATQPSTTTPHNVGLNSTHTYDVAYTTRTGGTVPNLYTWSIRLSDVSSTNLGAATSGAGNDYILTPGANGSINQIQWIKAGYYLILLNETNPVTFGTCAGAQKQQLVFVAATGTVEFASATGSNLCPAAGGYSLTLTKTGTISYPMSIDVTYTINGSTSSATISVANAGATLDIPAGVAFLNNLTATDDLTRSVKITAAHDSFGGVLTVNATDTHTLTIYSLPQTTAIHHD
jgi:hypothetical protein